MSKIKSGERMKYNELYNALRGTMSRSKFTNKHGEDFYIIDMLKTVVFAGHETDWEVIPLFNEEFDVWSKEELYKLGVALQELYKDHA